MIVWCLELWESVKNTEITEIKEIHRKKSKITETAEKLEEKVFSKFSNKIKQKKNCCLKKN